MLIVAQDDKPLKSSAKILIQAGTVERPTGWKTKPVTVQKKAGEEIVDFGHAPWQIVNGDITITLKNAALKTAVVLDANGMKVKEIPLEADGGGKRFKFPADALYVVVQ